jgi:hypothetical protein
MNKGFGLLVIVFVIVAVIIVGGAWYRTAHQPTPPPSTAVSNSAVTPCSDFDQFSSFVLTNAIDPTLNIQIFPGLPAAFQNGPTPFNAFRWKRKDTEPFVSYPTMGSAATSTYNYELDNKTIQAEVGFASANLTAKLPQEVSALGLGANALNTLPMTSDDDGVLNVQVFGFTKGNDLYTITLSSEKNYQASGGVEIMTACSQPNSAYDKFYDALAMRAGVSMQNPYGDDYIEVATTSPDGTVYELWGSSNHVDRGIADYYYFYGSSTPKLVSSDSSPAECNVLDKQKVGEGMECVNVPSYTNGTVDYSTPPVSGDGNTQTYSNSQYGISFQYPTTDTFTPKSDASYGGNNFVNQNGVVIFGSVQIPQSLYPGTNFIGGTFVASISPSIANSPACNQFSDVNRMPSQLSTITINGVKYTTGSTGSAAAGSESGDDYFHTYQNGFCYELLLEVNTFNRGALDNPSSVQEFGYTANLQNYFLSGVSFFTPTAKPPLSVSGNPAVTSFTASSQVAYSGTTNSGVTFSWTTRSVDYVQLSYSCADGLEVVSGANPQCQGVVDSPSSPNYSPNGSTTIIFGNENRSSPVQSSIPVTVTLKPFVNGMAVPNLGKTVNLSVTPTNAFPNGVPTTNNKMTLDINGSSFKQGSPVNITWTDSNDTNHNDPTPPDSCVDLYLVQNNSSGGETYLYQVVNSCVQPAMSGSYSWTVPSNYSGSGFHILGITPGLTANALSAPFTIMAQ